jgi:hypothetical protein
MIKSKIKVIMVRIRLLIEDQEGNQLSCWPSMDLELGNQSLSEIEIAVEKWKQKMLPEISSELLAQAQREYTQEKKKSKI